MTYLTAFHGTMAALVLCALLFAEETGVPIPLAPGDMILVAAGLLIAGGELSPWMFLPLALLATAGGAMVGYTWTRLLGSVGLQRIAGRLGLAGHLDRLTARLHRAGPPGIMLCRLIPGLRINTTLVAGAVGVKRSTFFLGMLPAAALWILAFTILGAVVGIPVMHVLTRVDRLAVRGGILLAVGLIGYLAARHVPAFRGSDEGLLEAPGPLRLALAAFVDLGTIASIVGGTDMVVHVLLGLGGIDDWEDALLTTVISILAYLILARGWTGLTAGEALFEVTYRAHRRPRQRVLEGR